MIFFTLSVTRAKIVVCISFNLNKIGQTEKNMIRPFCEDKHFTASVHFLFGCKILINHFDNTFAFFHDFQTRTVTSCSNE